MPASKSHSPATVVQESTEKGFGLLRLVAWGSLPAWVISMFFHVLLIVGAAGVTYTQLQEPESISLVVSAVPQEEFDTLTFDAPIEFETTEDLEMEFDEMPVAELEESLVEPILDTEFLQSETDYSDSSILSESEYVDMTEVVTSAEAAEGAPSMELGPESEFFKGNNKAKTVVYIVDNSISMTGKTPNSPGYGRMETALAELAKAINNLDKSQRFYVLFYSDTAYGLFHPDTALDYVYATPKNKQSVNAWLATVECCLRTKGSEAFEIARRLNPELIYLLGDGAFGDRAHTKLIKDPIKGARIETFGMNLTEQASQGFRDIAKAHGGNYLDVGISPEGRSILANFGPRKTNKVPGPYWGLALGDKTKKTKKPKKKKKME